VGTTRVEAFSDSVMAVIITIMAFELRPPQGAGLDAMRDQLPGVLVYVLSFTFVGIYWNNHHHLLRAADRISGAAMWANLFLLFWLSLIPVLTEWVRDEYLRALPAATYGTVALAAGLAYLILVRTLIRANGPESPLAAAIGSDVKGRLSLVLYARGDRPRIREPLDLVRHLCSGRADVVRTRPPIHPAARGKRSRIVRSSGSRSMPARFATLRSSASRAVSRLAPSLTCLDWWLRSSVL